MGYDPGNLVSLTDDFNCVICDDVAKDVVQILGNTGCKCINSLFCLKCILSWAKKRQTCPTCNVPFEAEDIQPIKFLRGRINALDARCLNHEDCDWKGELQHVKEHQTANCKYIMMPCPNAKLGCTTNAYRFELPRHLEQDCDFIYTDCKNNCQLEKLLKKDRDKHYKTCPKEIIPCINENCTWSSTRDALETHLEAECKEKQVPCPYAHYGCKFFSKRVDVDSHVQDDCIFEKLKDYTTYQHKKLQCSLEQIQVEMQTMKETHANQINDMETKYKNQIVQLQQEIRSLTIKKSISVVSKPRRPFSNLCKRKSSPNLQNRAEASNNVVKIPSSASSISSSSSSSAIVENCNSLWSSVYKHPSLRILNNSILMREKESGGDGWASVLSATQCTTGTQCDWKVRIKTTK